MTHAEALEPAAQDVGITIETNLAVSFPAYLGDFTMFYSTDAGETWSSVLMDAVTGLTYSADIPAQPVGTIVEYYFVVSDIYGGIAVVDPKKLRLTKNATCRTSCWWVMCSMRHRILIILSATENSILRNR